MEARISTLQIINSIHNRICKMSKESLNVLTQVTRRLPQYVLVIARYIFLDNNILLSEYIYVPNMIMQLTMRTLEGYVH